MAPEIQQSGSLDRPVLSVIVPARNEEASLARCLGSIIKQTGIRFELIVVDDGSTDSTLQIAKDFTRALPSDSVNLLRMIAIVARVPLPPGWAGKVNALWSGLQKAKGKWLLFTDADTVHEPGSLARAVAEAEEHGSALLSYSPRQEVRGFAERALMPLIFSELAATFPPRDVCDPASPVAAANGQYLLITREALAAVGGIERVAGSLLEDVALAIVVKSSGRRLRFRFAADAVSTRMYRTWEALREGWTKNLALLFPNARELAARRALEFAVFSFAVLTAFGAWSMGAHTAAIVAAAVGVSTWMNFFLRVRKAHLDGVSTLISIAGLPMFAYLLRRSVRLHRGGGVTWKGRRYADSETTVGLVESNRQFDEARGKSARAGD